MLNSKNSLLFIFLRVLQLFAELLESLLLLDLIHYEEPIHLILNPLLIVPRLIQLHLTVVVSILLIVILVLNEVYLPLHIHDLIVQVLKILLKLFQVLHLLYLILKFSLRVFYRTLHSALAGRRVYAGGGLTCLSFINKLEIVILCLFEHLLQLPRFTLFP